ncbi:hypothetical protein K469DRAFT_747853 [Zopfia rhizophila CBS 207.26]|uniref:Uncharacterized protein n=1 Tax=Zopfia rhizophila CBS 207.26 TaxID=1314779 RepID=A0A6A6EDH6_9PEZI|nr:hypothetical protein K469DRAFT_747853 [Zopfia rhizophila CBS 207.26]
MHLRCSQSGLMQIGHSLPLDLFALSGYNNTEWHAHCDSPDWRTWMGAPSEPERRQAWKSLRMRPLYYLTIGCRALPGDLFARCFVAFTLSPPCTATKSLRRSTRIAEREQQLCTATAVSSDSVKRPHQRTPKPMQMPTPPLTEPQEPEAPSPATKSAKRSRSKQSSRRDTLKPQGISKKKKKKARPRSRPSSD